jgi:hypothetical protein
MYFTQAKLAKLLSKVKSASQADLALFIQTQSEFLTGAFAVFLDCSFSDKPYLLDKKNRILFYKQVEKELVANLRNTNEFTKTQSSFEYFIASAGILQTRGYVEVARELIDKFNDLINFMFEQTNEFDFEIECLADKCTLDE